jgi:hypothetical protein
MAESDPHQLDVGHGWMCIGVPIDVPSRLAVHMEAVADPEAVPWPAPPGAFRVHNWLHEPLSDVIDLPQPAGDNNVLRVWLSSSGDGDDLVTVVHLAWVTV